MSTSPTDSMHRPVSLLAIACLAFVLVGPLAAWTAHQRAELPGSTSAQRPTPGEEFRVTDAGSATAVWGRPADLDRGAVRCTSNGEPQEMAEARTASIDGAEAVRLLDDEFLSLERLSCSGGGLEELVLTHRMPESTSRTVVVGALVATPVLVVLGLVLRRRGYRWPV